MGFDFTGKPPAFGTPTTFASFTTLPAANTPTRTGFATASFGSSFGGGAPFQQTSSTPVPFGTALSQAQASRDSTPPEEDVAQDDDLMRALKRCTTNRQAVFGRRDVDADAVLNEILGMCDVDARELMKELREASSEVGAFARAVFSMLLQRQPETKSSAPTTKTGEQKAEGKAEGGVPRWLSGEKRHKSKIPQPVIKRAKQPREGVAWKLMNDQGEQPAAISSDATPAKPFRFLDLPAEMRNIVYRELLVSKTGYIFLAGRPYADGDALYRTPRPNLRKGLASHCEPVILETCKQIYDEAKDILYGENKIIMSYEVEKSTKPFLSTLRIDLPSLAQIKSLVLVLDMCAAGSHNRPHRFLTAQDFISLVCWRELQAMTGLTHLRLTCVERADIDHRQVMLTQIMERIPAACQVTFGMETDFEKQYVQKVITDADEPVHKAYYNLEDSYEADQEMLRKCGEGAMVTKGCKSGDERDYRFADRSFSKLGSLAGGDTIDPRYVLGGGK